MTKLAITTCYADSTFMPVGDGSNGVDRHVYALARDGAYLYLAGDFTRYRQGSAANIARVNASSGAAE